jgi:hemerythrin superfamily protein
MSTPRKPTAKAAPDALDLLRADHDKVKQLFRDFDALKDSDDDERKAELVDEICFALTIHTLVEEEIFYPALRAAIDDDDLLDEADIEHAGARELISQLEVMYPGDDHFDAAVTVLGEEVAHHIDKEEHDMFDAARGAGIDLHALAARLAARKEELDDDLAAPPSPYDGLDALTPHNGTRRSPRPPN